MSPVERTSRYITVCTVRTERAASREFLARNSAGCSGTGAPRSYREAQLRGHERVDHAAWLKYTDDYARLSPIKGNEPDDFVCYYPRRDAWNKIVYCFWITLS